MHIASLNVTFSAIDGLMKSYKIDFFVFLISTSLNNERGYGDN